MAAIPVDPAFYGHLNQLAQQSQAASDAARALVQRKWFMPPPASWNGDLHDLVGMNSAFSRDVLNSMYSAALFDPNTGGTVGDCITAKAQIDWIATMERAFRTRHASRIRCAAHASARRRGHGSTNGIFTGTVLGYVQGMVQAAHNDGGAYSNTDIIGVVGGGDIIGKQG